MDLKERLESGLVRGVGVEGLADLRFGRDEVERPEAQDPERCEEVGGDTAVPSPIDQALLPPHAHAALHESLGRQHERPIVERRSLPDEMLERGQRLVELAHSDPQARELVEERTELGA